jgi:hypothetical protein
MSKLVTRPLAFLLSIVVVVLTIAWQTTAQSRSSRMNDERAIPSVVATAPSPPTLQPAILNGKPIQVLYITRAEDTVLVRCYPGYEPTLALRPMTSDAEGDGQQQGMLTCMSAEVEASN